jgi:hypothetical protein
MSNLTQFFASGGRGLAASPHKQPAFALYHQGSNNYHPGQIVFDHTMEPMNYSKGDQIQTGYAYPDGLGNTDAAHGFKNTYNTSTGAEHVYTGGGVQTGCNTFLGHSAYAALSGAKYPVNKLSFSDMGQGGKAARIQGSSLGEDQDYALFTRTTPNDYATVTNRVGTAAGFHIGDRSMTAAIHAYKGQGSIGSSSSIATGSFIELQAAGVLTSGYTLAIGGVCYNQRTKKLCILEKETASDPWRVILINDAPNPAKYKNNNKAYQVALTTAAAVTGARVVGTTMPSTNFSSSDDIYYWARPILCDTGDVYVATQTNNSNWTYFFKWPWNSGTSSYDACVLHSSLNGTTQYNAISNENGGSGWQFNQSLDGKTVHLSTNAYYYGTGIQFVLINTVTGGTSKIMNNYVSSGGMNVIPIGASAFAVIHSSNSDGSGVPVMMLNWIDYDKYAGGSGTYTGSQTVPTLWWDNLLDSPYYSTAYPAVYGFIGADNKAITKAEKGEWPE